MSNTSKIDAAIAAVKAKQAVKGQTNKVTAADVKPATARVRLTPEERKERDEAREAERAQRKAEREELRAKKRAEKEAARKPAHMTKVEKAKAKLPTMDENTTLMLDELTSNLTLNQLDILSQHLSLHVRAERTMSAANRTVEVGQAVTIVGGDPRYIGMTGTVDKAQRIRCYVDVPGVDRLVYLFIADVEPISDEGAETVTEDEEPEVLNASNA